MAKKKKAVTQMTKQIFQDNLLAACGEILGLSVSYENTRFVIVPVREHGKMMTGQDELMRLRILSEENIGGRKLDINEIVGLMAPFAPHVPVWINVSLLSRDEEQILFQLETSLRIRKPSELRNAETGHAPFKSILTESGIK